jgi:hypothetical protein
MFMDNIDTIFADKPICRSEQKRIYGVARNEAAEILCEVDAFPPPESFKWSFNNTAETFEMPQSDYRIHSSQASTLSYTPVKVNFVSVSGWQLMLLQLAGGRRQRSLYRWGKRVREREMTEAKFKHIKCCA